ncbi:MAG: hypothetical protein ABI770_06255 [Sphingomicrobium sp.]
MFLLAAAIIAAAPAHTGVSRGLSMQAVATVRVINGVRLSFGTEQGGDVPRARETVIKTAGLRQPAKLIEFQ